MRVRVILVLDAPRATESGDREAGDVARREDVVASSDAPVLVDDDAVVDRKTCRLGELGRGNDAEPGDDRVRRRSRDRRPSSTRREPSAFAIVPDERLQ